MRSQGPAWIINNSYDRPGNLRVCDVRSMLEARMVPEARNLRPPVLKPGNSKATSVRHVAGPDLSTDPIFPTIVMALADKSRPNHLNGERDFFSEDLAPLLDADLLFEGSCLGTLREILEHLPD